MVDASVVELGYHANLRRRKASEIECIVVHRIGPEVGKTGEQIAEAFARRPDVASYTGGQLAYSFVVRQDGRVDQCAPLTAVTAHARVWNTKGLGVAVIGDFRTNKLPVVQQVALVELLMVLRKILNLWDGRWLRGHDELPEGSSDPNKECPGRHLSVDKIAALVLRREGDVALMTARRSGLHIADLPHA